jgi:predicted alpha/beta hydrolase
MNATPNLSMNSVDIATNNDYRVPVRWLPAASACDNIVLMAALGVAARFYLPLAMALRDAGFNVALVEQRGHGDSSLRPSRDTDYGFRDALVDDIPAVIDWVVEQAPGLRCLLMGHSLGGHYAAITAGRLPEHVQGVVLVACGSPWVGGFSGSTQRQLQLLVRLIPVFGRLLGYYPGDRLGFGGREARTLMNDWRALAQTNVYSAFGLNADLDAGIAAFTGPVLSLRLADDAFAPAAAMAAVTGKFQSAMVSKAVIDAQELGDDADHFRWARTPAAIVRHVQHWHAQHFAG